MFYTRKGDSGTTKVFNTKSGTRISKCSCLTESLGALDELNSFLGLVKVKAYDVAKTIAWVQNCLFTIQAEVAGSEKKVGKAKVVEMEKMIDAMERELPPIKTFFISGGTEAAALLDIARTMARKAERTIIGSVEKKEFKLDPETLAFLNRLSSLFYVMARLTNHRSGIIEEAPTYK